MIGADDMNGAIQKASTRVHAVMFLTLYPRSKFAAVVSDSRGECIPPKVEPHSPGGPDARSQRHRAPRQLRGHPDPAVHPGPGKLVASQQGLKLRQKKIHMPLGSRRTAPEWGWCALASKVFDHEPGVRIWHLCQESDVPSSSEFGPTFDWKAST
jgi:hypothetical protein